MYKTVVRGEMQQACNSRYNCLVPDTIVSSYFKLPFSQFIIIPLKRTSNPKIYSLHFVINLLNKEKV